MEDLSACNVFLHVHGCSIYVFFLKVESAMQWKKIARVKFRSSLLYRWMGKQIDTLVLFQIITFLSELHHIRM